MSIESNLREIKSELSTEVTLVAVTKTKPNSVIQEAYDAGHRVFGENKIQEMAAKYEALPKDIDWHMIGHVQRNKVKYMASFVHLIHGIDSMKLLKEVNKQAMKHDRVIYCLLQIKIASEDGRQGIALTSLADLEKGIHTLGETCANCHKKDTRVYTDATITNSIGKLAENLKTGTVKDQGRELGTLAVLACARCHGTHRLSYDSMKAFTDAPDWRQLIKH